MSRSNVKELELEIEVDILTSGGLAEIVNSILEFLLFQRNQISFVYKTFRSWVNSWLENDQMVSSENLHSYFIQRQREKAIQTKENISAMRELIASVIQKHSVKSLRFLFGSTSSTSKEVYTMHLPKTSKLHMHDYHPSINLNQLLLSLLAREDIYGGFNNSLCPTNLFLELEILETTENLVNVTLDRIFPMTDKTQLPKSCKDVHFYIRHKPSLSLDDSSINCCRNLKVFDDELCPENKRSQNSFENQLTKQTHNTSSWWESDIVVRGFKEKLIKGRSIFSK